MRRNRSRLGGETGGPALERLEERLLLDAAPELLTPPAAEYVLSEGALTLGLDGHDADGDPLTFTVESDNPQLIPYIPEGNRFARLHFVTSDGLTDLGDIVVELFDGRAATAVERFVTLAENHVNPDGTLDPGGVPFYTDVVVHRVIPDFMIQTGDAANTGDSPLPDFPDEFDPYLSFAGAGVLAMANSGADTNNCQFFITAAASTWLDQVHVILGQMISGQDTFDYLINQDRDAQDRPLDPALMQFVEVIDGPQDASLTLRAEEGFVGEANVTVTLDDGTGQQTPYSFNVVSLGERPTIDDPGDVFVAPGQTQWIMVPAYDDGGMDIDTSASTSQEGAMAAWDPETFQLEITSPADFTGMFSVELSAAEAGHADLTPTRQTFRVFSQDPGDPPVEQRVPTNPEGSAMSSCLVDGRLYATVMLGLEVYDVSVTPAVLLGTYDTAGAARDVKVVGDVAYVADTYSGLAALDVSDPADIQLLGAIAFTSPADGSSVPAVSVAVSDGVAYVPVYSGGVVSVDVSDPAGMTELDRLLQPEPGFVFQEAAAVAVKDEYVFIADAAGFVAVLDADSPADMRLVAAFLTGGSPWGLDVAGDRLYIADQASGLIVYDVKKPKKPKYLDQLPLPGSPWQVLVANETAVVAHNQGYSFVDVLDPTRMSVEYTFATPPFGGLPSIEDGQLALPLAEHGVVMMDATDLVNRVTAYGKTSFLDDHQVTVSISAKNAVVRAHTTGPGQGDINSLEITPDSDKASVTIKTKGGETTVGDVHVAGSLKSFTAKTTNLAGDLTITGSVGKLVLGDAGGHTITIGADGNGKPVAITLGEAAEVSIVSETPLKSLTAVEWLDEDGNADLIQAPWIGKLTTKGNKKEDIAGDFQADLELDGTGAAKTTLNSAKIAGDLDGCAWNITGEVGKLTVKGTARNVEVRVSGSIKGVTLGAAEHADFLAGIAAGAARHAAQAGDFDDPGVTIKSVKIKGLKIPKGEEMPRFFIDSNFSAATLGAVSLLNVETDNGDEDFGLFALDAGTGKEIKSVKIADKETGEKWKYPGDEPPGDLVIEVLEAV